MIRDIIWTPTIGVDKYNKATYGTPVALKCQSFDEVKVIRNTEGEEVISIQQIYFLDPYIKEFSVKDKFQFIGESELLVLGVSKYSLPRTTNINLVEVFV